MRTATCHPADLPSPRAKTIYPPRCSVTTIGTSDTAAAGSRNTTTAATAAHPLTNSATIRRSPLSHALGRPTMGDVLSFVLSRSKLDTIAPDRPATVVVGGDLLFKTRLVLHLSFAHSSDLASAASSTPPPRAKITTSRSLLLDPHPPHTAIFAHKLTSARHSSGDLPAVVTVLGSRCCGPVLLWGLVLRNAYRARRWRARRQKP